MKNLKSIILRSFVAVSSLLICINGYSQTKLSGTVTDEKGEPVVGAVVMLTDNKSVGTMTDIDGNYSMTIPEGKTSKSITATSLGFAEQVIELNNKSVIDIVLSTDTELLDEAVVVGYGHMKRSDITGSVSSVKIDENKAIRSNSLDQLLQGNAAGVQVVSNSGSPYGGVTIKVRGTSTFSGNTAPIYVVDGIIMETSQGAETLFTQGVQSSQSDEQTNGLMGIEPSDIESIEILKDASATAIYGALGANGVVLITTKSAKTDKPVIEFSAGVDINTIAKKQEILAFNEYVDYLYAKKAATGSTMYDEEMSIIYANPEERTGMQVYPIDWQDYCLRTAVSQRYNFSIAGSTKATTYRFSIGHTDKPGIVKSTGLKKTNVRLNLDQVLGKRVKIGAKINFMHSLSDMTQGSNVGPGTPAASLITSMVQYMPYTVSDIETASLFDPELNTAPNYWINKQHFVNSREEYRVSPNIYAEVKITPWLTFKSTLGGDYRYAESQKFKSQFLNTTTEGTMAASGTMENFNINFDNMFLVNKQFGAHNLSGSIGSSAFKRVNTEQIIEAWNIPQYKAGMEGINDEANNTSRRYQESANQTLSFFARAVYNYDERYILTATIRADGSSKFQGANKWAYFPSVAAAWRINQEHWFNVDWISGLKLRAGWGQVGNQSISNYMTLSNYADTKTPAHDSGNTAQANIGLYPSNMANPSLKWETTEQVNAGIDISLFDGRLTFTADAYLKNTIDLLQAKSIPSSSGYSLISVNEGSIQNKGLEFTLSAVPVKTQDWEWTVFGNISINRNKVLSISKDAAHKSIWISPTESVDVVYFEGDKLGTSNYCSSPVNIFMEGYPVGLFYGYKLKGIVPEGGQGLPMTEGGVAGTAGQFDYYDPNGNGYRDIEDRMIIGDPNPDFTYGFGTTLTFRRLSLTANFNGSYGNDICNFNASSLTDTYQTYRNVWKAAYYDAWTPNNTNTIYPAIGKIRYDDYHEVSSYHIEDGSFLRLNNLAVSYSIPFKDAKILRKINVGVSSTNLCTWTKYRGCDPEVSSYGSYIRRMGVDNSSYPQTRTFSFDLRFTF